VVLKHPTWVKPMGIGIEILSVLIIAITVWSLVVGAKSLTSLAAYGTCDIVTPEACAIGDAEACYAGEAKKSENPIQWLGNWFVEWGEAFVAIPPKLVHWEASDYIPEAAAFYSDNGTNGVAINIFDPGCQWCRETYVNQKNDGFLNNYQVIQIPYALKDEGEDRFSNSDLIVRYIEATRIETLTDSEIPAEWLITDRLFTEMSPRQVVWQEDFKNYYNDEQAREVLNEWLEDFGYNEEQVNKIKELVDGEKVKELVNKSREIVENEIKIIKIPTEIYDGSRHDGVYK
ncbi:hypothetical protein LJC64_04930, partial [Ruminococcaceae bacterium OttesenSCG-928-A11]|nr:hypothetical protein [Ruminococcaceae bacterium OttesenSCG-928-A11]